MTHILLYAIVPILVVMATGFIAGRKGVFSSEDAKKFNKVVLDFALPSALFISIVQASREMLVDDMKVALVALVVIMFCFMLIYYVFKYCFKGNTGADGAIMALISGSPTIGFLGFAVLEPIFGTSPNVGLIVAIVGIVVNAVGIPVGLTLINKSMGSSSVAGNKRQSAWAPVIQALSQPVAWAPILAVIIVASGIRWPQELNPSFNLMAKANASMAVFAAGITLSSVKFTLNRQAIIGAFIKMIIMPGLLLAAGLLVDMEPENIKMLVVAGGLPPAFSGIIIADRYNRYIATGTSSLTISTILFIAFCPLWIRFTDYIIEII